MFKKLLIFSVMIISSINLFSQDFLNYTPKSKYDAAINHAKDQGLTDPILVGIATTAGDVGDIPISLQYNHETGNANVWVFNFAENGDPTQTVAFAMLDLFVTTTAFPISDEQLADLPPLPSTEINVDWMDSDEYAGYLMQNETAKQFFELPDSEITINYVALGVNEDNSNINMGDTYWIINANSDEGEGPVLNCWTHAETGETFCDMFMHVNEIVTDHGLSIYPNPANYSINIPLPNNSQLINEIKLIDNLGNRYIYDGISPNSNVLQFDVSSFAPGSYMLQLIYDKTVYIYPLMINR
jgi:hypothetical protein